MNKIEYLNSLTESSIDKYLDRTSSDITIKRDIDKKVCDTSWIDMVEECIPYLDNIIRNPRRFIVQEENIVPIEKAKVVTEEAIRHLAQNTGLIQEVNEDGSVVPLKILNVYREETIDLYENRFIKSLIDNLYRFVEDRLKDNDLTSYAHISNVVTYEGIMKQNDEEVKVKVDLESKINNEVDASKDGHSLAQRIEHIRDVIGAYQNSTFIKSLKECTPVRSPIRKTNVILKEPNFMKALDLWEFLEKESIKPAMEITKKSEEIKDNNVKELFDLAFYIQNDSLKDENALEEVEFDIGTISKLVNDFVFAGEISENDFKKLVNKEFKEAKKRKAKEENKVAAIFDKFIDSFEKRQKKALALFK